MPDPTGAELAARVDDIAARARAKRARQLQPREMRLDLDDPPERPERESAED